MSRWICLTLRKAEHHSSLYVLSRNYCSNKLLNQYINSSSSISHLENIVTLIAQQSNKYNQDIFFDFKNGGCANSK